MLASEPRTAQEANARIREILARQHAAAQRLAERRKSREPAPDRAAVLAEMRRERIAFERAALNERVFQIFDPEKLAREPRKIIARVAAQHDLAPEDILGPGRSIPIVAARRAAIAAVLAEHPSLTLLQLGRIFRRDHTTILHSLRALGIKAGAKPSREKGPA